MTGPSSGFGQPGYDAGMPEFGTGSPHAKDAWADPGQSAPGFGFNDSFNAGFDVQPSSSPSSKKERRHRDHNRDHHHQDDGQFPDTAKTMSPTSLDGGFDFAKPSSPRRGD